MELQLSDVIIIGTLQLGIGLILVFPKSRTLARIRKVVDKTLGFRE